jgi:uncharacterized protein YcgI (DUF1989 family)
MGRVLSEVEVDVHNALNVFIWTLFLKDTDQYFVKASPVSPGDYLELLAGVNRLGGLSVCPGRDCGSMHFSDTSVCYPLRVGGRRPINEELAKAGWYSPLFN